MRVIFHRHIVFLLCEHRGKGQALSLRTRGIKFKLLQAGF